jgi:hypothetical protein
MRLQTILILLLFCPAIADNYFDDWPVGKTEKMTYSIVTLAPVAGKSINNMKISKIADGEDKIIEVSQVIDVIDQPVKIRTIEQYNASNLELISSVSHYILAPEAKNKMNLDSLVIRAGPIGDSLEITTSTETIPSARVSMEGNLVTGIGAMLLARSRDYENNQTYNYNQVNLLSLSSDGFKAVAVIDSVYGKEMIVTGIGNFDCVKVLKTTPDIVAFSYYYKDFSNLPVMIEGFDRNSLERTMNITLTGYKVISND